MAAGNIQRVFGSWPDNTALAVQALLAAGETADNTAVQNGLGYLQSMLSSAGGWGDSSTTAYAIMALNALGISKRFMVKRSWFDATFRIIYFPENKMAHLSTIGNTPMTA